MDCISFLHFFSLFPRTLEQSRRGWNREHQRFLPKPKLRGYVVQAEVMSYCGLWCQTLGIHGFPLVISTAPTSPPTSTWLTALVSCQCLKHAGSFLPQGFCIFCSLGLDGLSLCSSQDFFSLQHHLLREALTG